MFILGWKLREESVYVYINRYFAVSVFLKIFQIYEIQIGLQDDMFLVSLFAGVFVGVGLGIIFRFGGTTGGVDIIARLAAKVSWLEYGENDVHV